MNYSKSMALSGHCGRISGQMPTRLKSSKHVHQHSGILLTLCPCLRGREGGTEKGKMAFYCISISIAQAPPPTPPHTAVYNKWCTSSTLDCLLSLLANKLPTSAIFMQSDR